jgi:hypothetical protein
MVTIMIKRRKYYSVIALICALTLIFPVSIFAQDEGADAAGTGTKGADIAGAEAGKETKAGISTGTIIWGTVALALIAGGILALAGGGGGGGGSSVTTPPHH